MRRALARPPGFGQGRLTPRPKPALEAFLQLIHEIFKGDRTAPRNQRHTAERIYDRLKAEHGCPGSCSSVKKTVRGSRAAKNEVFVPLMHPPAHSQVEFGEATVVMEGAPKNPAQFVTTLVYSDAVFIQAFPRECTQTFQEGRRRAFQFLEAPPDGSATTTANSPWR